jgi:hypothetical protein
MRGKSKTLRALFLEIPLADSESMRDLWQSLLFGDGHDWIAADRPVDGRGTGMLGAEIEDEVRAVIEWLGKSGSAANGE